MTETAIDTGSLPDEQPTETQVPETADPTPDPNTTANGEKLDRQTRNWRALERDRDHWREMAMRQAPPQTPPPAPTPKAEPVKTLADFEYDDAKYQSYLIERVQRESVEAAKRALKEDQERESKQKRWSSFSTRQAEYAKTVEDYNDSLESLKPYLSQAMSEVIVESDDGPALAYHLAKNQEIAARIAELPPIAAAKELGKIEARLAYEREQAKAAKVSKAPPPPPKVDAVEATLNVRPDDPDSDKVLSDAEWVKRRNKQLAKRS